VWFFLFLSLSIYLHLLMQMYIEEQLKGKLRGSAHIMVGASNVATIFEDAIEKSKNIC
jgi:hypothetical protein